MLCGPILTYNTHGLPWSKDQSYSICTWIKSIKPSIVCLQEVFLESVRTYYKDQLTRAGYTVVVPRDTGVTFLSSGLLTAFLDSDYRLVSDFFGTYAQFHNVEWFVNKGFHALCIACAKTSRRLTIINTHTQSDSEVGWFFRNTVHGIRKQQFHQIVEYAQGRKEPVLVAGDLNCEVSPHPHLRFLHPVSDNLIRKATFYSTGEDLDHIAWIPLQWARAKDGTGTGTGAACGFCDIERNGPVMESCTILQKPWSDHAPVLASVRIPYKHIKPS